MFSFFFAGPDKAPVASTSRHEWTSSQTKRLISIINDRLEDLKSLTNKQAIWKEIAGEFSSSAITATKCEDKWKNLKKSYRDYVQRSNQTGSAPSKFEFADETGQVMGDDPSVIPKMTLDSEGNITSAAEKGDDE